MEPSDDIETISSCSDNSNDSESDFYVVPLPDCFNPNLPLTASASSVVVTRGKLTREEVRIVCDFQLILAGTQCKILSLL